MEIKKFLLPSEMAMFANDVVQSCFVKGEDGSLEYLPYLRDYAERLYILKYYGEFIPDEDETIEAAYEDKYQQAVSIIDPQQLESLREAISEKIEFEKSKILFEPLHDISDKLDIISEKKSPVDELLVALTDMIGNLSTSFEGVDMKQFTEDIKGVKLDANPEALLEALVKSKGE